MTEENERRRTEEEEGRRKKEEDGKTAGTCPAVCFFVVCFVVSP
jgi:hypothetical protein